MPENSEQEIGGYTERDLNLASWWVRHHSTLRRLGYILLIAASVVMWLFVFWELLDYYAISYPRESRVTQNIAQNVLGADAFATAIPQAIQFSEPSVFQGTGGRQDMLVLLNNPNPMWWADFTYQFSINGEMTPARQGYILPQSQREITELGWKTPGAAQFSLTEVHWHRIQPQAVERDYTTFASKRLQFRFDNLTYSNDLKIEKQTVGQTSFTLVNPTAFGYWSVDVTVVLYKQGAPSAITTITEQNIKPGESRPISINWFENLPGITKTDIQASVNILDPNVYLPTTQF